MHLITPQAKADQQQPQTHTCAQSHFLGTQIDMEVLQKSSEEEGIGEGNVLLA